MPSAPGSMRLGNALNQLNPAQREAVEYLTGPLLVLAGPGTGKTQLLSTKVAYVLDQTDLTPDNILCITFTENAAANMRDRLATIIGPAAAGQVHIHTYHSFGTDILNQYKNYTTTPQHFDNPIDEVTQHKVIQALQADLPATDILRANSVSDIRDTISSAKSARLTPEHLATIAKINLSDTTQINQLATPILQQIKRGMKLEIGLGTVYQPLLELLTTFTSPTEIAPGVEKEANFLARSLNEAIATATDQNSISPLTTWKRRYFEDVASDASGAPTFRLKNLVANLKLQSLAQVYADYQAYLAEHHLFDYSDMIEQAILALQTDEGFRLTLSERYQYILLDEFQDTNPSQFELIKLITAYDQPNLMAVGDDDQAIFEFQGANASNLLDFQAHYQAHIITLTENYRSTQDILDFSHRIADQIADSFAKQHHIDKVLHANRPTDSTAAISRHEFITSDAEYHWIAQDIKRQLKSGTDPTEIAIIAPKNKYIAPLLPYLKQQRLDVAYEKRDNLLADPKITQLITLSRYIYALAHNQPSAHLVPEVFSFPFWDISHLTLLTHLQDAKAAGQDPFKFFAKSNDPALQQTAQFIADLTALVHDAPLELFLDYLIGTVELNGFTSPYLNFYQGTDDFHTYELYEHLNLLKHRLADHLQTETPHLADFLNFVDDYTNAGQTIQAKSPYQDSDRAIQILTVHGAKGLEYQHVYLIAVDNLLWGGSKGNNNLLVLPANLIHIRHTGATEDERLRKLFVAITRAKTQLTLTNSVTDYSGKTPARLTYLQEEERATPTGQTQVISPLLPNSAQTVVTHYQPIPESERQLLIRTNWISAYQKLTPELLPLIRKQQTHYRLTATDLTAFINLRYAGPQAIYRKLIGAPSEPYNENIVLGNLIHATFEAITNNGLTDIQATTFFEQKAATQPIPVTMLDHINQLGTISLEKSLQQFGPILRAPGAKAEVNFSSEHLSADGIPITGKIDHLNIDETTKTIELYDFKTGKYKAKAWDKDPGLYMYALQLSFYKLLLNLSPTFRKYKVTSGHILYVTPNPSDPDLRVYDKVYDFSTIPDDQLLSLMRAVYHQIKTLEFVQDPALNPPADQNLGLKDILNFTELLQSRSSLQQ